MTYLGPDGKTYTPNQLKRFIKIDHLDNYEEPEGGYVTAESEGGGNGNNEIPELPTPNSEAFKWNLPRSGRIEVVENWKVEFPDFKFDNPGTMKQTVTITAPNKKTLTIKLGSGGGDKVKEAKVFNEFMEKNKKNPEEIKGRTPKEIKESVAKGEESKFNVGPDGELLSEGYTMNDLGKVVWVGVGPEPTNT